MTGGRSSEDSDLVGADSILGGIPSHQGDGPLPVPHGDWVSIGPVIHSGS
jgi:hypothetical protein